MEIKQLYDCSLDINLLYDFSLEINLDGVLERSERLFFRYCKKSVEDSFQLVDTPHVSRNRHR